MKKILSAAIVSATVITGLGMSQADAASGNTIQNVQQIHHGDQSLEGVRLGENIQDVLKTQKATGYSYKPDKTEHYYEFKTSKGFMIVTADGQKDHGVIKRISMEYNKPDGPTFKEVRHQLGNTVKWRYHYDDRTGNFGYVKDGKTVYQFGTESPKDRNLKLYRIDIEK
ncbi:SA0570 family protein [Staphylococcus carnosus]|uniref:Exported protein n=2 Tax=Staphylococcus carnosus TaxID=1281 RepID=B9DKC6_STACT|nr:hypothetical protein [Staphylococcus carnosus]KKB25157.1 hypothetical protein VV61_08785 [Staphylococcus carnosus]POA00134.1 hypothetical protein CD153_09255 [Staphylococcus carnosus]QPT03364.1 hypothetical protein I6G40_09770 [Staphylococcus carnosus]QQS86040.1 hypothetical protein I6J04_04450 [Staphylococcus carnosus]QRQ05975.1 hypothetical protein I6J34_04785 [Staphylococcus carnosus]